MNVIELISNMPFLKTDGSIEPFVCFNAEVSDNTSQSERSIGTEATISDSDMDDEERHLLQTRFSGPQFIDEWRVYTLKKKCWYGNIGKERDAWVWKHVATCQASEPLSKANFFHAFWMKY